MPSNPASSARRISPVCSAPTTSPTRTTATGRPTRTSRRAASHRLSATPEKLNTSSPTVREALGDAISDLQGAHVALDAAPGDVQAVVTQGRRIPVHGGIADPNGDFNAVTTSFTPGQGFGSIYHGSSFV